MLGTILLVILIVILLGGITPFGRGNYWGTGYYGGGGIGIVLIVVILLLYSGRL